MGSKNGSKLTSFVEVKKDKWIVLSNFTPYLTSFLTPILTTNFNKIN